MREKHELHQQAELLKAEKERELKDAAAAEAGDG